MVKKYKVAANSGIFGAPKTDENPLGDYLPGSIIELETVPDGWEGTRVTLYEGDEEAMKGTPEPAPALPNPPVEPVAAPAEAATGDAGNTPKSGKTDNQGGAWPKA